MTPIPRGLLIAGGLGLAAGAGFLLFKGTGGEKPEGVDPASKDPAAAAGAGGVVPTAGTPGATGPVAPGAAAATGTAISGTPGATSGSGKLAGGQQVGPYTVLPDPQSGQMVVFETATEQPVGVLDAQGNLLPLEAAGGIGAGSATGGVPQGPGLGVPAATGSSVPQAQAGQAQFAAIAKDLFAGAGNGSIGSASSDAMAGQTNLAPATGLDAGAASSTTPAGLGTGQVRSEQVGNLTVLDDGSGTQVVVDTASQQPVAMMDAAGNVTPISVDAAGNVSVAGAPVGSAASGAASLTPGAGASSPVGVGTADASAGAMPYAPAATVTSPATVVSPIGGVLPGGS